ncbi:MAG: hypothetical protein AAF289_03295 [Cyanobacteria bacterium P01_A01_bin.135]
MARRVWAANRSCDKSLEPAAASPARIDIGSSARTQEPHQRGDRPLPERLSLANLRQPNLRRSPLNLSHHTRGDRSLNHQHRQPPTTG